MRNNDKKTIFVTGATGLLGSNLILELLKEDPELEIIALVRANSDWEANRRLRFVLESLGDFGRVPYHRVSALRGDITFSQLGLDNELYQNLIPEIDRIIHCAATVQLNLPLDCARAVNLDGTKNVMALARLAGTCGRLRHFSYISTAFVSGDRDGSISENDLDCGQDFSNSYEQTKFETETYLRGLNENFPISIFRPGIIVGNSQNGLTGAFNVLYAPLKLIQKGMISYLPGFSDTPLDVLPVDFVSRAIAQITLHGDTARGETYHVTAGRRFSPTAGEIVKLAMDYFNAEIGAQIIGPVKFVSGCFPMQLWERAPQAKPTKLVSAMSEYAPYLSITRDFDNSRMLEALGNRNLPIPRFRDYYRALLAYCLKTGWGKLLPAAA
jgi:thioester reductase-like protein